MSPKAAPRSYRLFEIDRAAGRPAMRVVFLDIGALGAGERAVIDRFCDGLVACDVAVSGRIGEVVAERRHNPFAADGGVTVTVGLVAERIRFLEAGP